MNVQIIECEECQGEGFIYRTGIVYEPGCGHPHMGDVCHGLCPTCHGSCVVETEIQPRTLADLEQEDFDMMEAKIATNRRRRR